MSEKDKISILLVDDNSQFLDLACRHFRNHEDKFDLTTCQNPENVLEILEEEDIDCVLSDYSMPEMTGIELLEKVREKYSELPFIIVTSNGSEEVASESMNKGVTDYIKKTGGMDYDIVINRIKNAIGIKKAQNSNRRIVKALETAKEGISLINKSGKIVYLNQAYAQLFGYEKEELAGQDWGKIGVRGEPEYFDNEIWPALEEKGKWKGTTYCVRKDGTEFLGEHSLALTEEEDLICAITDVTEQERTEQTYQTLVENFPQGRVAVFNKDLEYTIAGGELLENQDLYPTQLEGKNIEDVYPDEELEILRPRYLDALNGESSTFNMERKGRQLLIRVIPLKDKEGKVFSGMAVAQDITEVNKKEQRLEDYNNVVSHDLKNPLNNAMGYINLLRDEKSSEELDIIAESLEKMSKIIEEMEIIAENPEILEREELSLQKVFEEAYSPTNHGEINYDIEDGKIEASKTLTIRVFENLIKNSIEHNENPVRIKVGHLEDGKGFYYEDDGEGIDEETREKIFQKGHTTKEGSHGMGMNIIQRIGELHNWNIEVTESENGGARFEFYTN